MPFLKEIRNYFDLNQRTPVIRAQANPNASAAPQYIALVLGIIIQPFVDYYIQHNTITGDVKGFLLRTVFGLVIGIAIFPAVYKKAWDPNSTRFVQLCSIFSSGLGWQTLFAAGAHLASNKS